MKLVGLTGVARSGKDTVGGYMVSHYDFLQYAFANPIRKVASAMFGLPENVFEGDNEDREVPDPFWGISPREMLQKIGTEGARDVFGQDIWVKHAHRYWSTLKASRDLDNYKLSAPVPWRGVVITDVRFDNEAKWIQEQGGIVLSIERPGVTAVNEHRSENGVHKDHITHHIVNDRTQEDLRSRVCELFDQLL